MTKTTHTITLNTSESILVGHWGCSCERWGIVPKSSSAAATRSKLLAAAEQHLDEACADRADFDALASL